MVSTLFETKTLDLLCLLDKKGVQRAGKKSIKEINKKKKKIYEKKIFVLNFCWQFYFKLFATTVA